MNIYAHKNTIYPIAIEIENKEEAESLARILGQFAVTIDAAIESELVDKSDMRLMMDHKVSIILAANLMELLENKDNKEKAH